jgi:hypothetical protein
MCSIKNYICKKYIKNEKYMYADLAPSLRPGVPRSDSR